MTAKQKRKAKAGRPHAAAKSPSEPLAHSPPPEAARDLLLKAAIPLFAKKGYDGTSVKDIAEQAGVNISLVSYHFKGKEGLYKTCFEQFGRNRLAATERLLQPPQTLEECRLRLGLFMDDMMVWFDEEPDLCAMVQRESEMGFQIARDVFENTFLKVFQTFFNFLRAGQTKGFLRPDFDTEIATRFFFTGLVHTIQKDDLTKKKFGVTIHDPAYRKKLMNQISQIFFEGLGKNHEDPKKPDRFLGRKK